MRCDEEMRKTQVPIAQNSGTIYSDGPQPSIFVRRFSQITTMRKELPYTYTLGVLPEGGRVLLKGEDAANPGASSLRARGPRLQRPGPFQDRSSVGAPFMDHGERQLATGNGPVIGSERPGGIADPPLEAVVPVAADARLGFQRYHLNRRVDVDRVAMHVILFHTAIALGVEVPSSDLVEDQLPLARRCGPVRIFGDVLFGDGPRPHAPQRSRRLGCGLYGSRHRIGHAATRDAGGSGCKRVWPWGKPGRDQVAAVAAEDVGRPVFVPNELAIDEEVHLGHDGISWHRRRDPLGPQGQRRLPVQARGQLEQRGRSCAARGRLARGRLLRGTTATGDECHCQTHDSYVRKPTKRFPVTKLYGRGRPPVGQHPLQDRSDHREREAQRQAGEDPGSVCHQRPGGEGMTMFKRQFLTGKGMRDHLVSPSALLLDKDRVFKRTCSHSTESALLIG
jgi:hypothetical protein